MPKKLSATKANNSKKGLKKFKALARYKQAFSKNEFLPSANIEQQAMQVFEVLNRFASQEKEQISTTSLNKNSVTNSVTNLATNNNHHTLATEQTKKHDNLSSLNNSNSLNGSNSFFDNSFFDQQLAFTNTDEFVLPKSLDEQESKLSNQVNQILDDVISSNNSFASLMNQAQTQHSNSELTTNNQELVNSNNQNSATKNSATNNQTNFMFGEGKLENSGTSIKTDLDNRQLSEVSFGVPRESLNGNTNTFLVNVNQHLKLNEHSLNNSANAKVQDSSLTKTDNYNKTGIYNKSSNYKQDKPTNLNDKNNLHLQEYKSKQDTQNSSKALNISNQDLKIFSLEDFDPKAKPQLPQFKFALTRLLQTGNLNSSFDSSEEFEVQEQPSQLHIASKQAQNKENTIQEVKGIQEVKEIQEEKNEIKEVTDTSKTNVKPIIDFDDWSFNESSFKDSAIKESVITDLAIKDLPLKKLIQCYLELYQEFSKRFSYSFTDLNLEFIEKLIQESKDLEVAILINQVRHCKQNTNKQLHNVNHELEAFNKMLSKVNSKYNSNHSEEISNPNNLSLQQVSDIYKFELDTKLNTKSEKTELETELEFKLDSELDIPLTTPNSHNTVKYQLLPELNLAQVSKLAHPEQVNLELDDLVLPALEQKDDFELPVFEQVDGLVSSDNSVDLNKLDLDLPDVSSLQYNFANDYESKISELQHQLEQDNHVNIEVPVEDLLQHLTKYLQELNLDSTAQGYPEALEILSSLKAMVGVNANQDNLDEQDFEVDDLAHWLGVDNEVAQYIIGYQQEQEEQQDSQYQQNSKHLQYQQEQYQQSSVDLEEKIKQLDTELNELLDQIQPVSEQKLQADLQTNSQQTLNSSLPFPKQVEVEKLSVEQLPVEQLSIATEQPSVETINEMLTYTNKVKTHYPSLYKKVKEANCPHCLEKGKESKGRIQRVNHRKDGSMSIQLQCTSCGKYFSTSSEKKRLSKEDDLTIIKELKAGKETKTTIAKKYGISLTSIYRILERNGYDSKTIKKLPKTTKNK